MTTKNPGISGHKVVYALFTLAFILALTVFLVGLREKHRRVDDSGRPLVPTDTWKDRAKTFP